MSLDNMQMNCLCESAISSINDALYDYEIECREIELSTLRNSMMTESVGILYEDAEDSLKKKSKGAIGTFFEAIAGFIKKMTTKIAAYFTQKKTEQCVANLKKAVEDNPELRNEKVEVYDIEALSKAQEKHLAKVRSIFAKQQAGRPLSDSEVRELERFENDDYSKISKAKVIIPIASAIAAIGATTAYCKLSGKTLTDISDTIKDKFNDTVEKSKDLKKEKLAEQMRTSKLAITRLNERRAQMLPPINENIKSLNQWIDSLNKRDANMAARAQSSNIFLRGAAHVGQFRQDLKNSNNIFGGPMPSREQARSTYSKQLKQQEKNLDKTEKKLDRKLKSAQNKYDWVKDRLDRID